MNNVELVKLEVSQLEMVRNWRNFPHVSSNMYTDDVITEAQQLIWFDSIKNNKSCEYWVVHYKGEPVGVSYLTDINHSFKSCYMGFYLKNSSVRGSSIAAKLEYTLLEYVFDILKFNKLMCEVFDFNQPVISMHEKFGFRREAYYRNHCMKQGKYQNVVGLAILKHEWSTVSSTLGPKIYGKSFLINKNGK